MTNKDEWREILKAQLACLDEISEDDIGKSVYVRNRLDYSWEGPYTFVSMSDIGDNPYPFRVEKPYSAGGYLMDYSFVTRTIPIEPQAITLIPWDGGDCPLSDDENAIVKFRNDMLTVVGRSDLYPVNAISWKHDDSTSRAYHIVGYYPIDVVKE